MRPTPEWFRDAKFGVIVHWGLYSIPGWAPLDDDVVRILEADLDAPDGDVGSDPLARHSYAEWYQNSALLDGPTRVHHETTYGGRDYGDFRAAFGSAVAGWSAPPWAALFAAAGCRYVIPVTKHHDGFLLWPSTVENPRRAGWQATRDVIGELGDVVRAHGMRYGLYYSGAPDWTFGPLPIRRLIDIPDSMPSDPEYPRYVDAHWRELIHRYRPDILWNDIMYPPQASPLTLIADYYEAVPDGVVNDRFGTDDPDVRTPDDRGGIPAAQRDLLHGIGRWLDGHGEAIYGTRPWTRAEGTTGDGQPVRFTSRGDTVYGIVPGAVGDPSRGVEGLPAGSRIRRVGTDAFAAEPGG